MFKFIIVDWYTFCICLNHSTKKLIFNMTQIMKNMEESDGFREQFGKLGKETFNDKKNKSQ